MVEFFFAVKIATGGFIAGFAVGAGLIMVLWELARKEDKENKKNEQ